MTDCVFEMPVPPSLNNIYKNAGRIRVKTRGYIAWKASAVVAVERQHIEPFTCPVVVDISVPERRGDIDNRAKPVLDVMTAAGVITDDSNKWVREVRVRWIDKSNTAARISVKEAVE